MRAHIVYAHPEPTSFTAALCEAAREELLGLGAEVSVADLYAEGFDPTAGRHDFTTVADGERFHYQSEQLHAAQQGGFAPELAREQSRLAEADLLILVFPLWWGGVPAILKGWIDRVLAYGVAYEDGRRFEEGYFQGRRSLLGLTTGGGPRRYSPDGVYGSIDQVLWPVQRCVAEYLGYQTAPPFVAYGAPRAQGEERRTYLGEWRTAVRDAGRAAEAATGRRDLPAAGSGSQTGWNTPG